MKRKVTILSILFCLFLILPTMSFGQYVVGNTVSNFTLNDVDGNPYSLYDYMGDVVLLNFYATWWPGCNEEAPHLENYFWRFYRPYGFQVLSINIDDTENNTLVRNWGNALGLTYPLLQDVNDLAWNQYGMGYIPHNTLLDTNMTVLYTYYGFDEPTLRSLIDIFCEAPYANNVNLSTGFLQMGLDTLVITSVMKNLGNHNIELYAMLESFDGALNDSLMLFDDGMHNDGAAGDNLYGNSLLAPNLLQEFTVGLKTVDLDYNEYVVFEDLSRFTTIGPVVLEAFNRTTGFGSNLYYYITLRNTGSVTTAENVMARLIVNDPYITNIIGNDQSFGDIDAGQTSVSSGKYALVPSNLPHTHTINFTVEIYGNGNLYWTDSSSIVVGITNEDENIPKVFALKQNFPNPFNPSTTIEFSIPKAEFVELKIFDISGKEFQTLVSDNMSAGTYQYDWQATDHVASGIYYYVIKAGEFSDTKKLVLLK